MESDVFERELQEWMKNTLNPYCLGECKISCCDCGGTIQIDKGYEHLFKIYRLTGKKVPIQKQTRGEPHLFKSKDNGLWYFWGKTCPNYDAKNKKCLIHNEYPRCALYPIVKKTLYDSSGGFLDDPKSKRFMDIKTGKPNEGYTLFSVCSLHKLKENQEPLKSLIQLCKKHGFKLFKENT
jgi:Fe-S-cluster containining protein